MWRDRVQCKRTRNWPRRTSDTGGHLPSERHQGVFLKVLLKVVGETAICLLELHSPSSSLTEPLCL